MRLCISNKLCFKCMSLLPSPWSQDLLQYIFKGYVLLLLPHVLPLGDVVLGQIITWNQIITSLGFYLHMQEKEWGKSFRKSTTDKRNFVWKLMVRKYKLVFFLGETQNENKVKEISFGIKYWYGFTMFTWVCILIGIKHTQHAQCNTHSHTQSEVQYSACTVLTQAHVRWTKYCNWTPYIYIRHVYMCRYWS